MVAVVAWVVGTTIAQEVEAVEELPRLEEMVQIVGPVVVATLPLRVLRQGLVWQAVVR
jgi:hypothetical protein